MDATNLTAWGTFIGVVCAAVGGLVGGLMTLWYTKGTASRVAIIKAEGDIKLRSQAEEIVQKDLVIQSLTDRIGKLEEETRVLRQQGHDDRNKWYADQLKCTSEAAELRGELRALQSQFNHFLTIFSEAHKPPVPVNVINPLPIPVTAVGN